MSSQTWTRQRIEALGPVTDVATTAGILDVNANTIYAAIDRGEWTTTRVLRVGRRIRIPTSDLVRALYLPEIDIPPQGKCGPLSA